MDPNAVKVVTDAHGMALYFSRAPIPWNRDGAPAGLVSQKRFRRCAAVIAAFTPIAWRRCCVSRSCHTGALEQREKLEQLRALEHGLSDSRQRRARAAPGRT